MKPAKKKEKPKTSRQGKQGMTTYAEPAFVAEIEALRLITKFPLPGSSSSTVLTKEQWMSYLLAEGMKAIKGKQK